MDPVINFMPIVLGGMALTVGMSLAAMLLATGLGLLGAWARIGGNAFARGLALLYTILIRGVPPLALMLLMYFGGQTGLNALADLWGVHPIQIDPFTAGVISIGFIFGAYLVETFRGAYDAIPHGEIEAGLAIGMHWPTLAREVILTPLMRLALPSYWNIWLTLVKASALVSVIGLKDAVYSALTIGRSTRQPFTFMLVVLVLYLMYTAVADLCFRVLRRRLERGVRMARI